MQVGRGEQSFGKYLRFAQQAAEQLEQDVGRRGGHQGRFPGAALPLKQSAFMLSHFSRIQLCATPWTAACQAPLCLGLFRQECWSGLHALLQGIFLNQGSNLCLLGLLHWWAGSLLLAPPVKPPLEEQQMLSFKGQAEMGAGKPQPSGCERSC